MCHMAIMSQTGAVRVHLDSSTNSTCAGTRAARPMAGARRTSPDCGGSIQMNQPSATAWAAMPKTFCQIGPAR